MNLDTNRPIAVAVELRGSPLRRAVCAALERVDCRVAARRGDVDVALVITDRPPESAPLDAGPPILELRPPGQPPHSAVTASVEVDGADADLDAMLRLARHLIEQERRWGGAWISTRLLRRPGGARRSSSEPPAR